MWPFVRTLSRRTILARSAAATLVAAAPALGGPARAETKADERRLRLDRVIDRALAEHRIVGSVVLVMQDGDIVYRRAAGHADREADRPMREDAMFRLASLSKPIVSVAAMALVERGRLDPQNSSPDGCRISARRPRTARSPRSPSIIFSPHTAGLS